MIRASIIGAGTEQAGELFRILIHHPDVEIVNAVDSRLGGMRVDSLHRGLVGDTDMCFSTVPKGKTDVFFVCDGDIAFESDAEQRVIDLTGRMRGHEDYVYGICELNRKPLVRGATKATAPSVHAHGAVLAMLPLAQNLLLNSTIDVKVEGMPWPGTGAEIAEAVRTLQSSFMSRVNVVPAAATMPAPHNTFIEGTEDATMAKEARYFSLRTVVEVDCGVNIEHLRELYENYYDDHNFTFMLDRVPVEADVANTNKCLIHIEAVTPQRMRVTVMIDPRIKGNAGNAVHLMNLLFGLHERTGLNLMPLG